MEGFRTVSLNDENHLDPETKSSRRKIDVAVPFVRQTRRSPRLQSKQIDPRVPHPSIQSPQVSVPEGSTPRKPRLRSTAEPQDGPNTPKRLKVVQSHPGARRSSATAQYAAQQSSSSTNPPVSRNPSEVPGAGVTTTGQVQARGAGQQRVEWIKRDDAEFYPGLVISTPWHEPDVTTSKVVADDVNRTETSFGRVYSKVRKLIVIEVFDDHCLTIPIFSFHGKGLQQKDNKDDFVGVRDQLVKPIAAPESRHPNLIFSRAIEYRNRNHGFHVMTPTSNAHFTYPVSFRYEIPCCFEGRIIQDSHRQLVELYNSCPPVFTLHQRFGGRKGRMGI